MKLNAAAQITANPGVRTRVDTTVAMELAASWNPFRKSKASARTMMMMTYVVMERQALSRLPDADRTSVVLDDDPLQDVGHVLAVVGRRFETSIQLLPLDEFAEIARLLKELRGRVPGDEVGFVLEVVDLDQIGRDGFQVS